MAKVNARVLKGFRDYLPAAMLPKQRMLDTVARVFESYGFAPLSTPALEYSECLLGKYGDEGDKLLYRFRDNGDRDVAMRYDLTVPLARVMGMNRNLPLPFKRYQIAPVWRAEKPGRGRYREFMQCDVDVVGSASLMADAECMAVGAAVLQALGVERFQIRVNNRKLLTALMERLGVAEGEPTHAVLRSVDKLPKIGEEAVRGLLVTENGLTPEAADGIFEFLALDPGQIDAWFADSEVGRKGAEELSTLLALAEAQGLGGAHVAVDLSIARGLDYYTGTIYETFLGDLESLGSVMSGGRYDDLLGMFGGRPVPAVGISLGVDRLLAGLTELELVSTQASPTQVLVTLFDEASRDVSYAVAGALRAAGVPTEIHLGAARMKKQLKYADQQGIPFVVVAGPDEIERGVFQLKALATREQLELDRDALVAHLSSAEQAKQPH